MKALPPGKAPGPDGLTGEYFKQFGHQLAPHLTTFFNEAATASKFAHESLQALIITLLKPGKEPERSPDLPPKLRHEEIYAKTIATRLLNIMPTLIHKD